MPFRSLLGLDSWSHRLLAVFVVLASGVSGARVTAQTVNVPANVEWFDTGIDVRAGAAYLLSIGATGQWTNIVGGQLVDAAGYGSLKLSNALAPTLAFGSLIGRVNGIVFAVGTSFRGRSPASGRLYLSMNDVPGTFADNTGQLTVVVTPRVNAAITSVQDPVIFLDLASADPTPFDQQPVFHWMLKNRRQASVSGELFLLLDGVQASAVPPGFPFVQGLGPNSELSGTTALYTGTPPHLNAGEHTVTIQLRALTPNHEILAQADSYIQAYVPVPAPVPPPSCPVDQAGPPLLIALVRSGTGADGALLYSGSTSTLASSCINRLDSFEIVGSAFPVRFAEAGKVGSCLSSTVVLGPNATPGAKYKASSTDVTTVFNEAHPKLPISLVACVNAGGSAPDALSVVISYTTRAS